MTKTRIVLIVLIILSSVTSLATITKVFAKGKVLSAAESRSNIQEIEVVKPTDIPTSIPSLTPTSFPKLKLVIVPSVKPTLIPTAIITPKPTTITNSNNTSSLCIITLQGQQYDVTTLRTTHSGGNIFKCGTDMTSVYQAQHGTSLARMKAYIYTPGPLSTTANVPTAVIPTAKLTKTINQKDEKIEDPGDDRDDQEHEDRYYDD